MQITFNTPFGFSPDSTPEENREANRILRDIVQGLNAQGSGARATLSRSGRCLFTFDLPSLFCAESTPVQDGNALQVLLKGLTDLNRAYLRNHVVPDLSDSNVVYGRTDIWDTIPALYSLKDTADGPRAFGDCKSLTACRVAQYEKRGIPCSAVFRWIRTPQRTKDYHILVLTGNGFEDPSKEKGMGTNEVAVNTTGY